MNKELLECGRDDRGRYVLTIRVPAADFSDALEEAYRLCKAELEVPGVPKGEATREQAEAALGRDVFYPQAARQCCARALEEAVAQRGLQVAGYPDIQDCSTDAEGLLFTALCDPYPTARLGDYKKLRVHLPEPTVEAGELEQVLEQYARRAARHIPLDRPAREGDTVRIDLEGTLETGGPVPGGKAEDYALKLGSHTFLPGLEEGMAGMSAGERRDIPLTFPKDHAPELAGRGAVFHVTVREVCRVEVPPVDEAFAREFFQTDLATLRAEVRQSLLEDKLEQHRSQLEEAALTQAAGQMDCLLPESMIQKEMDDMTAEFCQRLESQGSTLEQYLQSMKMTGEEFEQTARKSAVHRLRQEVLLKEVARAEGLEVDDKALRRAADGLARQYGATTEVVLQALTPAMLEREALRRMVLDVLLRP